MKATVTENGAEVCIASKTRNGAEFSFVLTRMDNESGESTRVHLVWGQGASAESRGAARIQRVLNDLGSETVSAKK